MQTDWQAFLQNRGAEFETGLINSFGNPERELRMVLGGNIICDLSHYALLSVTGEDAVTFLHSQLINDIQALDETHSHLNGYCNPKGRMLANFRVFKHNNALYLRFPSMLVESVIKRLTMYKLRSKVNIKDASNNFARIGLSGKTADTQLAKFIDKVPEKTDRVYHSNNLTIIRVPGITPSYELYGDTTSIQDIWTKLDVDAAPVGQECWELIEILAGIPHITLATSEKFVPQMLNYQALNGLNLEKGCYPGQEIVARMHYLGKLKKRMYLAKINTGDRPEIHQELVSRNADTGRKAGNIVNVSRHPDGGYAVLAVTQISNAESTDIRLGHEKGPRLEIIDLPYVI